MLSKPSNELIHGYGNNVENWIPANQATKQLDEYKQFVTHVKSFKDKVSDISTQICIQVSSKFAGNNLSNISSLLGTSELFSKDFFTYLPTYLSNDWYTEKKRNDMARMLAACEIKINETIDNSSKLLEQLPYPSWLSDIESTFNGYKMEMEKQKQLQAQTAQSAQSSRSNEFDLLDCVIGKPKPEIKKQVIQSISQQIAPTSAVKMTIDVASSMLNIKMEDPNFINKMEVKIAEEKLNYQRKEKASREEASSRDLEHVILIQEVFAYIIGLVQAGVLELEQFQIPEQLYDRLKKFDDKVHLESNIRDVSCILLGIFIAIEHLETHEQIKNFLTNIFDMYKEDSRTVHFMFDMFLGMSGQIDIETFNQKMGQITPSSRFDSYIAVLFDTVALYSKGKKYTKQIGLLLESSGIFSGSTMEARLNKQSDDIEFITINILGQRAQGNYSVDSALKIINAFVNMEKEESEFKQYMGNKYGF